MPRAPSEKVVEAEKMFSEGMAMVDIAKRLGISDGTVRSWKNRYGWDEKSKKNKRNVAKKAGKKNATQQKRKRGGQPNNKNAKGGRGNPSPKKPIKHGGYMPVFMDALDEDEKELIENVPDDEETLLLEQIQLFSIRERRILKAINKYREAKESVAVENVIRYEDKRSFKSKEEEEEYNFRWKTMVDEGDVLPGKPYGIQTSTTNKDMIIARLEQELSTVQGKKTKAIEALSKLRLEKQKISNENIGNEAVDDWIAAILGEEADIRE